VVIILSGKIRQTNMEANIIWEDGGVDSDISLAADLLELKAREMDGRPIGPLPPGWTRRAADHLSDPRSFLFLAHQALDDVVVINRNEVDAEIARRHPEEDIPDGAVA